MQQSAYASPSISLPSPAQIRLVVPACVSLNLVSSSLVTLFADLALQRHRGHRRSTERYP